MEHTSKYRALQASSTASRTVASWLNTSASIRCSPASAGSMPCAFMIVSSLIAAGTSLAVSDASKRSSCGAAACSAAANATAACRVATMACASTRVRARASSGICDGCVACSGVRCAWLWRGGVGDGDRGLAEPGSAAGVRGGCCGVFSLSCALPSAHSAARR